MRMWTLIFALSSVFAFGAEIKDVAYACGAKECSLRFRFASAKDLPNFFQKYDADKHLLTVGFSNTVSPFDGSTFALRESAGIRGVRVFTDNSFKVPLLKFEFAVGESIRSEKNPVSLADGKSFVIALPKTQSESWSLQKMEAAKTARDKKLAADSVSALKKAQRDSVRVAKATAELEKKRAADSVSALKKAQRDSVRAAKATAELEKKRAADSVSALKKAKQDSIREWKEQSNKKVVSALLEGIRSMTGIQGGGMEQFRIVTDSAIRISDVKGPDKSSILYVSVAGPKKTPLFNVSTGGIVKSVTWMSSGLRIQLYPNVHPAILVYKGSLILQVSQPSAIRGFVCYMAKPEGVFVRKWISPTKTVETFDEFSKGMDSEKKKIVSVAQSFGLRRVSRNLIVVAESTPFLASPSENAEELESLDFGTRLEDMDLNGLYYKVRLGSKVGYVNRRAVSFPDELSAVQSERLKQLAMEQGGTLDTSAVRFEHPIEERVSYSSFGRRDPFIEVKGLMEEGINIDQVELVGIIWESEVPLAILADSKNPEISYTVKEGDRILNGKVLKITQTDVLFLLQEFGVSRRYSMSLPDLYGSTAK